MSSHTDLTELRQEVRALRGRVSSIWLDLRRRTDELEEALADLTRDHEEYQDRLRDMEDTLGRFLSRLSD